MPSKRPFSPWSQLVPGKQQTVAARQPCGAFPVGAAPTFALENVALPRNAQTHTYIHAGSFRRALALRTCAARATTTTETTGTTTGITTTSKLSGQGNASI